MDVETALRERRTVHRYRVGAIPEEVLALAFEMAILAPNHRHTWPWRFTRVGPETREALVPLTAKAKAKGAEVTDALTQKVRSKLLTPAELIVVSQRLHDDPKIRREDYAACACAIQNLTLVLHARGFGTKWGTGAVTTKPETYELVGIDPADEEIIGFLYAGVPEDSPNPPPRPPMTTFVRGLP